SGELESACAGRVARRFRGAGGRASDGPADDGTRGRRQARCGCRRDLPVPRMSALDAFRLDGKVAIVTGAGRGIGASIARTFADAGANIVLTARTKEQLDEVAADVRAAGREALVIPADVNNNDVLEEIVARTVAEL